MNNEELKHLITPTEFAELARPVSIHLDDNEVQAFINECEQLFIIPAIGYGNYKAAVGDTTWDTTFDDTFNPDTLVSGGEWELVRPCVCDGARVLPGLRYCAGLKRALAYFVYAKMARADGAIYSRAGFMQHDDQYAHHVDDSKLKQYNDTMSVAETYLGGCLLYLKYNSTNPVQPVHGSRARIHAIGD